MIVDLDTMKIFLDMAVTDDSQNEKITPILNAMDAFAKERCHKTFEQTAYTNELYDGTGSPTLFVKNPPIISVVKVAVSRDDVIKIKNTSTDASNATVNVDSDSLDLLVAGGANADSSSLALATYTTLATLIAAVNAVGKGWSAEVADTDYNSILSAELLTTDALYCGARAGTTPGWEYLQVAGEPVSGIRVNRPTGEIYYPSGFPSGFQNITVSYVGGYTTANLPPQVSLAIMTGVKALWNKRNQEGFGISDFSLGHLRIKYTEWIPETVKMLDQYREVVV